MNKHLKVFGWISCLAVLLLVAGCCGMHKRHHAQKGGNCAVGQAGSKCADCQLGKSAAATAEQRQDRLYLCGCGPECKCNAMSTQPGNCGCGKPLQAYHVVKVEKDETLLCTCGNDCACGINPKDSSKCACGKELKRVSLKGSGIYFCNCGGACTCNHLAAQPGTCGKCGMDLIKVD